MTDALIPHDGAFRWSDTGLVLQHQPSFEEWEALGCWLKAADKSMAWLIGDWFVLGGAVFGEAMAQALDPDEARDGQWSQATLEVYGWVCRRIPPERRRADLTFAHNQLVAALEPKEQTAWLERAALDPDGVWSIRELRGAMKASAGKPQGFWVLVSAADAQDAEWLTGNMLAAGRNAKVVEK